MLRNSAGCSRDCSAKVAAPRMVCTTSCRAAGRGEARGTPPPLGRSPHHKKTGGARGQRPRRPPSSDGVFAKEKVRVARGGPVGGGGVVWVGERPPGTGAPGPT